MSGVVFSARGNAKDLAAALARLSASASRGSTLPILSTVRLRVVDGELEASATNLDQYHALRLPVSDLAGAPLSGGCVALSLLMGLLRRCNGDVVSLELSNGLLSVAAEGRRATLPSLPMGEFPETPLVEVDVSRVPGHGLAGAMEAVRCCISTDEARYVLNGVYLAAGDDPGGVEVVATDGRRLALMGCGEAGEDTDMSGLLGCIVPTLALPTLVELLDRAAVVEARRGEGRLEVRVDGEVYSTRLIEGMYPNYRQVVPDWGSASAVELRVDREALRGALEWARVAMSKTGAVRMSAVGDALTIRSGAPDGADVEEVLPLLSPVDAELYMTVNLQFLADFAARDGGEVFRMRTVPDGNGAVNSPVLIADEDPRYLGVLMPMRAER